MDPATIASLAAAFNELWKLGGIIAVLLAALAGFSIAAFVVAVRIYKHLTARLIAIEDDRALILKVALTENTASNFKVAAKIDDLCDIQKETLGALRSRPCLIESGVQHRPNLPRWEHG